MGRGLGKLGLYILGELERRSFAELRELLPADATDKTYKSLRKAAIRLADAGLIEIRRKRTGLTKRDTWRITVALPGKMPSDP